MSKQPEALRLADELPRYKTIDCCNAAAAELRRLQAENEALRAQIGQGVPDGWQLVPKEPTDEMVRAALHLDLSYMPGHDGPDRAAVYETMLASAPPAPQQAPLTTCNCRWNGGMQVQQCELHKAHVDAIHEWAERAKTAEAKLSAPQQKPLTDEPEIAACGLMPLIEDYAIAVHNGDENSVTVLKRTIEASLEELESQQKKPLTQDQIKDCAWGLFDDSSSLPEFVEPFVRAIEAAHNIGEKK